MDLVHFKITQLKTLTLHQVKTLHYSRPKIITF